jgi:hypothetical protein
MPRCGALTKGMDSGTLGPPAILRRSFLKGELQQPPQRPTPLLKPALQRLKESVKDGSYHLPRGQTTPLHRAQPSHSPGWASWLFRRSPKRLPNAVTILSRDLYQVYPSVTMAVCYRGHIFCFQKGNKQDSKIETLFCLKAVSYECYETQCQGRGLRYKKFIPSPIPSDTLGSSRPWKVPSS